MARLRPGVSAMQAQAALAGPFSEWARSREPEAPAGGRSQLVVREGSGGLDGLRRRYSKPLYILLTLVGLILSHRLREYRQPPAGARSGPEA